MADEVKRGNAPNEYKEDTADLGREVLEVRAWRERIDRNVRLLRLEDRKELVDEGDRYLDGTKGTTTARGEKRKKAEPCKVRLRYLLPILEDLHRKTLPAIPTPSIQARNEQAEQMEPSVRQFLSMKFEQFRPVIEQRLAQAQWDDDRWGNFILKVEWGVEYEESPAQPNEDVDSLALDVEKAQAENADPKMAKLGTNDAHDAHIRIHLDPEEPASLSQLDIYSEEYAALSAHVEEHSAELQAFSREDAHLARVDNIRYVYDCDVPWEERAWEAECRSVKIQDLIDLGYRNVNPENLPPETRPEVTDPPKYEDLTAQIWDIHDRRNKKHYIIPVAGPDEGRFLHRADWPYGDIDIYKLMCFRPYDSVRSWGISTIQAALPILEELATVDYYIRRHVKLHASYKRLFPDSTDTAKFKAGLNNPNQVAITVSSEAMANNAEIKPHPIPITLLTRQGELLNELRRITGLDAQDTGQSNPHQISATESGRRGLTADARKNSRQETMATFLTWYAHTMLKLYRNFATKTVPMTVMGEMGMEFIDFDPAQLPLDYDIMLDVHSETDEHKALGLEKAQLFVQFILESQIPVDYQKLMEWYGRELGVRRPEQFRMKMLPVGPENTAEAASANQMPALPGGPQQGGQQPQDTLRIAQEGGFAPQAQTA